MNYILPGGLEGASVEIVIAQDKIDGQVDFAGDALQLWHNVIAFRDIARDHQAVGFQSIYPPNPLLPRMRGNRVQVQIGCPNQTQDLSRC